MFFLWQDDVARGDDLTSCVLCEFDTSFICVLPGWQDERQDAVLGENEAG